GCGSTPDAAAILQRKRKPMAASTTLDIGNPSRITSVGLRSIGLQDAASARSHGATIQREHRNAALDISLASLISHNPFQRRANKELLIDGEESRSIQRI